MKKISLLAFFLLALPAASLGQVPPVNPVRTAPPAYEIIPSTPAPELPRFDLEFKGDTPGDLVRALEQVLPGPVNVIIPSDFRDTVLPSFEIKSTTVPELFSALSLASVRRVAYYSGTIQSPPNQPGRSVIQERQISYGFRTPDAPPSENSVWYFYVDGSPKLPEVEPLRVVRFYNLSSYLEQFQVEDIITAVQTGWGLSATGTTQPKLRYHEETRFADQPVLALALLPDRILVAGTFDHGGGNQQIRIVRLHFDGSLDATFLISDETFGAPSWGSAINAMAPLPDGKLLVAGRFQGLRSGIARLNSDGSLDESFDAGFFGGTIADMAVRPDGRIIIVGAFFGIETIRRGGIAQLLPDGALDLGFDPVVSGPDPGAGNARLNSVVLQPDGKVIISGEVAYVDGIQRLSIARLHDSAPVDRNILGLSFPGSIQEDATNLVGQVIRMGNRDRELRVKFATVDGTAKQHIDYQPVAKELVFQPGERAKAITIPILDNTTADPLRLFKVVLEDIPEDVSAEYSELEIRIYDDELGVTFSHDQFFVSESAEFFEAVVYLQRGWLEATVDYETRDGTALAGRDFMARSGRLQFSSWWQDSGLRTFFVPILDNASLDGERSFTIELGNPSNGVVLGPIASAKVTILDNDTASGPAKGLNGAIQASIGLPDGRVIIGGWFTSVDGQRRFYIARLNADGADDPDFDTSRGPNGPVLCLALQPDGKILIGGRFTSVADVPRGHIARLNPDGSLDMSFDPGSGWQGQMIYYETLPEIRSLAIQSDGKILAGGNLTNYNGAVRVGMARIHPDGSLDDSFNAAMAIGTGLRAIAVRSDGNILVAGALKGSNVDYVASLDPDGSLDQTFEPVFLHFSRALFEQQDGKILVGTERGIFRLNPDGSLDDTFSSGGLHGQNAKCFFQHPNGDIWIGGAFFESQATILKLRPDGSMVPILGGDGMVRTLALQQDRVFAGGAFNGRDSETLEWMQKNFVFGGVILGDQSKRFFWKQLHLDSALVSNYRFERIVPLPSGETHLSMSGQSSHSFRLEGSANLRNWIPLATNTSLNAGMTFRHTNTNQQFYYRARTLQQ